MADSTLQSRLNLVIALLLANLLLLLQLTYTVDPPTAVGWLILVALIGYGHYRT